MSSYISLLRKPVHIPSTGPFDISDYKLKTLKIQGRDGIETDVEEDECPFEERVDSVGYDRLAVYPLYYCSGPTHHQQLCGPYVV